MIPLPPRSTRTDPLLPNTTPFLSDRSDQASAQPYKPALFVSPTAPAVRPADATAFGRGAAHRLQRPEHRPGVPNDLRQCVDVRLGPAARRRCARALAEHRRRPRSEEHTSELQSLMRISYAVLCLTTNNIFEYHNRIYIVHY